MAATRYNLTGTKGMNFSRRIVVKLRDGTVTNATFPTRIFLRHDGTAAAVCLAETVVIDPAANLVEMRVAPVEMDKLDPDLVYSYQIDGVAQDQYAEPLAQGRFYVEPRYTEGGGNP